MENQSDFLFADGPVPDLHLPDPRSGFYGEVAAVWNLPLGQKIRVLLKGHDFPEVASLLEPSGAPELPLNACEPLQLSVGGITFLSTQVEAWSLLGCAPRPSRLNVFLMALVRDALPNPSFVSFASFARKNSGNELSREESEGSEGTHSLVGAC